MRKRRIKFQQIPMIMAEAETLSDDIDSFSTLSDEMVLSILDGTDVNSLQRICIANSRLYQLCQEPKIWKRLEAWNPIPPPDMYKTLPFTSKKRIVERIFPVGQLVYGYYADVSRRVFIVTRHTEKSIYVRGVQKVYKTGKGTYDVKRPIQYWTPERRGTVKYSLDPSQARKPLYIRAATFDLFPVWTPIHNYWVSKSFKAL